MLVEHFVCHEPISGLINVYIIFWGSMSVDENTSKHITHDESICEISNPASLAIQKISNPASLSIQKMGLQTLHHTNMYYFHMNNLFWRNILATLVPPPPSPPNSKWCQMKYTRVTFKYISTDMQMWKHKS